MTVIFKHLRGRGDSPSTHLNGGSKDWRQGEPVENCMTSPSLSSLRAGRAFTPKNQKKGTEGRTLVMDKPVVSMFE